MTFVGKKGNNSFEFLIKILLFRGHFNRKLRFTFNQRTSPANRNSIPATFNLTQTTRQVRNFDDAGIERTSGHLIIFPDELVLHQKATDNAPAEIFRWPLRSLRRSVGGAVGGGVEGRERAGLGRPGVL